MEEIRGVLNSIVNENYTKEDLAYIEMVSKDDNFKELLSIKESNVLHREILKIRKEALLNVVKQKFHRYYSNIIDLSTPEELATVLPELAELKKKEEDLDDIKSGPIMFITISPENTVGVYELIKYLEKLVKLKFIKKYLYVLEQRFNGEPNDNYKKEGDGLHSHLLINKEVYKTSHVKRDVGRIFKNMVCNVDYKFIKERDVPKVQNYMIGEKSDDSKKIKQNYDRVWRKAMGLKNFYGDLFQDMDEHSA